MPGTARSNSQRYASYKGAGIIGEVLRALALSARSIAPETAPGTLIGAVANLLSGSALALVSGAPFVALAGANMVKGTRAFRPGYHNVTTRETKGSNSKDTTLTLKAPRTSVTRIDFEDVTTNWVHTDAAKATADRSWFMSGAQSMNIAQPAGAANQSLLSTRTLDADMEFGLDKVFALDINNKGTVDPGNIAIRFLNAAGQTLIMNVVTIQNLRKGVQTLMWCGKHMKDNSSLAPADFAGPIKKVAFVVTGAAGVSISLDRFRENAKGRSRGATEADDGYDDFYTKMIPLNEEFGFAMPTLNFQVNITKQSNAQVPRITVPHLQDAALTKKCPITNHSMTHPDFTALSKADQAAQFQGCIDYIHGTGPRVAGSTDAVGVGDGPTGVDISYRTTSSGRRVKSSAYHAVMPGGTFNADTIAAARDVGMMNFTGVLGGGYGDKDGMGGYWALPRFSGNVTDPTALLAQLQICIDTGQSFRIFFHDFGRVDAGNEGVKTAIGVTMPVARQIYTQLKAWVDAGLLDMSLNSIELFESLAQAPLPSAGVNLAGADFGGRGFGDYHIYAGVLDLTDPNNLKGPSPNYTHPTAAQVAYYASKGVNTIRFPFRYHHIYNVVSDADPTQDVVRASDLAKWNAFLDACAIYGITVIIDMHEYGFQTPDGDPGRPPAYHTAAVFYQNNDADKNKLAKRWVNVAKLVKGRAKIRYGIMNEPTNKENAPKIADLFVIQQYVMTAIAAEDTNPDHRFHVCGWGYSSAVDWTNVPTGQATSNAIEFAKLVDPRGGKPLAEVHQYLDLDQSNPNSSSHPGKEANPLIPDMADSVAKFTFGGTTYTYPPALKAATEWARATGNQLFLGEYAFSQDGVYSNEGRRELRYCHDNRDAWEGHTMWGPGPWWQAYDKDGLLVKPFSPEPRDLTDPLHLPQLNVLSEFLPIGA